MSCYRAGGCGPYENRSCNECPASKPEYLNRDKASSEKKPIKVSVFMSEDGVVCVMTNTNQPIEVEFVDIDTITKNAYPKEGEKLVDNYQRLLLKNGFNDVKDDMISTIEDMGQYLDSEDKA